MHVTVNDLKTFYDDLIGRIARRIIRVQIQMLWPDCKGLSVMGLGYAGSYIKPYLQDAERVICVMPKKMGVHHWPKSEKNLVCLSDETLLPLHDNSVDRIVMIHCLEFSDNYHETFNELWRVLKSSGRLIVIVPNRLGLWARADWTPFGMGTPFSAGQVRKLLAEHDFVHERTRKILYIPPFKNNLLLRSAKAYEAMGRYVCAALCGLHMVEVSKQIYAIPRKGTPAKLPLINKPVVPASALSHNACKQK